MDPDTPPPRFDELCFKIGLAVIQGQKVQYALAHYFGLFQIVRNKWTKSKAEESITKHLSKPMGVVIDALENESILGSPILQRVKLFKKERNWLAHDFDQESTPYIRNGQRIPEYISRMDSLIGESVGIINELSQLGEVLCPVLPA